MWLGLNNVGLSTFCVFKTQKTSCKSHSCYVRGVGAEPHGSDKNFVWKLETKALSWDALSFSFSN